MIRTLFLLFSTLLFTTLFSCKTAYSETTNCATFGKVIDLSQLDGCQLMIELKDGTQLLPVANTLGDFELQAGQSIIFSYEEVIDAVSICMSGDKMIRLTCVQLAPSNVGAAQ
ncbi:MAG: hypothetical protein AAF798_10510 [Bacteroidota bacterium]